MPHLRPVPDPKPPPRLGERAESQPSVAELERWATVLRLECVRMLAVAKSGHLDSSLSAADIVAALYYRVLRHDPENPRWPERDRFVLCKGHAAPIQYAALAHHGYFPLEDLMGLRQIGTHLQGHPDMTRTTGVEVSTGSLGQGLSIGLGMALAARLDAAESVPYFLTTLFALHERVRPFNKYLCWELEQHPLSGDEWSAEQLLPLLEAAVAGDLAAQRSLFRKIERLARGHGHGDVIDGWGDDVDWLRGG
jgi:hypothetical protein